MRLLPRSLATRTATVLLLVVVLAQGAGLTFFSVDQSALQRLSDAREISTRFSQLYRSMVSQPEADWAALVQGADPVPGVRYRLDTNFVRDEFPPASAEDQQLIRPYFAFGGLPQPLRPRLAVVRGDFEPGRTLVLAVQAPDERWLVARVKPTTLRPWASPRFLVAFGIMTLAAVLVTWWTVRRMTAPLRVLAEAADRLGRDVNAPPLPQTGPTELAAAAAAFNLMSARIRRFVADRTFLLTAIGHDLRTPITRLKLRAEWMDDDEQRRKMLADLDELEAMVQATLAFGRDVAGSEPAVRLDLPALLRTVLDEASDARPGANTAVAYTGPSALPIEARPVALKRAFANMVGNALTYGGAARVTLEKTAVPGSGVAVHVDDDGPGIPPGELERVFEPFYRMEASRSRETGGSGLGLPITRNIMRAHGGDITLANRAGGGLRATLTLPG